MICAEHKLGAEHNLGAEDYGAEHTSSRKCLYNQKLFILHLTFRPLYGVKSKNIICVRHGYP